MDYIKGFLLLFFILGVESQEMKPWQEWTECSATCGNGIQERTRECANGRCTQKETRGCQIKICPGAGGSEFDSWEPWSRCSKTCGKGIQERKRRCSNGTCVHNESQVCQLRLCEGISDTHLWPEWSSCSTTCGQGIATRVRKCPDDQPCQQKQTKTCYLFSCKTDEESAVEYKNWQRWSKCSATCGSGTRKRIRRCKYSNCRETEIGSCRAKPCRGQKTPVPLNQVLQQILTDGSLSPPALFPAKIVPGKWQPWLPCSVTCGFGTRKRIRRCRVGVCEQTQTQRCVKPQCVGTGILSEYKQWQPWAPCSATCGPGERKRIRRCNVGKCEQIMTKTCFASKCTGKRRNPVYQPWKKWGPCSTTCGWGVRVRERQCTRPLRCVQTQSQSCNPVKCGVVDSIASGPTTKPDDPFHNWGDWSECSVTCGTGKETRRRQCKVGGCVEIAERSCRKSCLAEPDPKPITGKFLPWEEWTPCSATCGIGKQTRQRRCRLGGCVEKAEKSCRERVCAGPDDKQFHPWEEWSACDVTCGSGKETRRRRCKVGGCVEVNTRTCRQPSCTVTEKPVASPKQGEWSPWSACSATCGAGEMKRSRSYPEGSSVQEQLTYCNIRRCLDEDPDKYADWMPWSGCSVTCDTGVRSRVRFCKIGSCRDTESSSCKMEDCETNLEDKYGPWQEWGECSKTCGFGFSIRKRYCNVGTCEQSSSKTCRIEACPPDYKEWEPWGPCSVTCGSGISKRKRFCKVGSCEEEQETTCDMEKCGSGWEDWANWNGCHKSCGGGFDYRLRRCREPTPSKNCQGDNYGYKRCNTQSCSAGIWGPWGDWSKCTVSCGTGEISRSRKCAQGECDGDEKETSECNTVDCIKAKWSEWGDWGECSTTCGNGERSRTRTCIDGRQWQPGCLGSLIMKDVCDGPPCKRALWSEWSTWTTCSVSCGRGETTRERICIDGNIGDSGCRGDSEAIKNCFRPACRVDAKWSRWTTWSKCSVTCGGGSKSRSRECLGGKVGNPGCFGEDQQTDECNTNKCLTMGTWNNWLNWSTCSVTCGIGTISRTRVCDGGDNCEGKAKDSEICEEDDCNGAASWGDWSDWSICSASCGIGLSLRIRKCEGGSIGDEGCKEGGQESQMCNDMECDREPQATWMPWSDWSACPVSCGSGTQARSRTCSKPGECQGDPEQARICNETPCNTKGRWSDWQKWEDCPVPCGSGISRRTRTCIGGEVGKGGCVGRRTQHRRCEKPECEWSDWELFGACSVTCGTGTKTRTRKCADGAMEVTKCDGPHLDVAECKRPDCAFDPTVTCQKVFRPFNSDMTATNEYPHPLGTEITFECDIGYETKGDNKIICMKQGRWSGPAPYCAARSCRRNLKRVENGMTCPPKCESDNQCEGIGYKCLCDGWCGKSCFNPDAECEPLNLPENGYILSGHKTYGYKVDYGCNPGYILTGVQSRVCRSDGRWTGLAPKCFSFNTPGIAGDIGNILTKNSLQRVIGGKSSKAGAWPWQVVVLRNERNLLYRSLDSLMGGASIINQKWILTAAHLVAETKKIILGLGVTEIPKKNSQIKSWVQFFEPEMSTKHEKFDRKSFDYDIALIKVGKRLKIADDVFVVDEDATHGEITFSQYVRPVALPCISACDIEEDSKIENGIPSYSFDQTRCIKYGRKIKSVEKEDGVVITGFGDTTPNTMLSQIFDFPESLQQSLLKLLKSDDCVSGVKRIKEQYKSARFTSRMLCTGNSTSRDACQGDSGGPLVRQVTNKDGDKCFVQLGIISWGWGCANKDEDGIPYPGLYADTSVLMHWIVGTLNKYA
uniref:SCO-spondin-like isoform X2 n=1 Tax=Styela clava TaxID=7725 RepID=UPI00193A4D8C|nr:SCO-spondin-like isoform X2 [Styela clava]